MASLTVQEALQQGQKKPWAWVRSLSAVSLGPTPSEINEAELLEARFFDQSEEVRIFRRNRTLEAVSIMEGDSSFERQFKVENPMFGGKITVRYDLKQDDDGQMYISDVCLAGWEGKK